MQEQNKENLIFLGKIALLALVVFFTIVMLTYVGEAGGLWSTPLPLTAIGYGIYCFIKRYFKKANEKEDAK